MLMLTGNFPLDVTLFRAVERLTYAQLRFWHPSVYLFCSVFDFFIQCLTFLCVYNKLNRH